MAADNKPYLSLSHKVALLSNGFFPVIQSEAMLALSGTKDRTERVQWRARNPLFATDIGLTLGPIKDPVKKIVMCI